MQKLGNAIHSPVSQTRAPDKRYGTLQQIVETNNVVRKALEEGLPIPTLMENWDFLQNQCAMEINSDMPGVRRDPSEASVHIRYRPVLLLSPMKIVISDAA